MSHVVLSKTISSVFEGWANPMGQGAWSLGWLTNRQERFRSFDGGTDFSDH